MERTIYDKTQLEAIKTTRKNFYKQMKKRLSYSWVCSFCNAEQEFAQPVALNPFVGCPNCGYVAMIPRSARGKLA